MFTFKTCMVQDQGIIWCRSVRFHDCRDQTIWMVQKHVILLCRNIWLFCAASFRFFGKPDFFWKASLWKISSINSVTFILVCITVERSITELVIEFPNVQFWQDIFAAKPTSTIHDLKHGINFAQIFQLPMRNYLIVPLASSIVIQRKVHNGDTLTGQPRDIIKENSKL